MTELEHLVIAPAECCVLREHAIGQTIGLDSEWIPYCQTCTLLHRRAFDVTGGDMDKADAALLEFRAFELEPDPPGMSA